MFGQAALDFALEEKGDLLAADLLGAGAAEVAVRIDPRLDARLRARRGITQMSSARQAWSRVNSRDELGVRRQRLDAAAVDREIDRARRGSARRRRCPRAFSARG